MSRVEEITAILTEIAFHLQSQQEDFNTNLTSTISSLNQTLNLNNNEGESRVRVLETTLSLMCFKTPQVFNLMVEDLVQTIVTVLKSSIMCKVLRFQKEEFLQIGSSISRFDCEELVKACLDIIGRLEEHHGTLSHMLFRAVLRVTASASSHQILSPFPYIRSIQQCHQKNTSFSKLHSLMPEEISISDNDIPLRLLMWYLDPLTLKHDISSILSESSTRPFLYLKKEMHERMRWRSIVLSLVLSPTIFIQTRALLHNWFLVTGSTSVLQLQIVVVLSVLDVLAQPIRWGLSMEMGSKLPFSQAYFPHKQPLLLLLAGTVSCKTFLELVHFIKELILQGDDHSDLVSKRSSINARMIDHKSTWALLMNFPVWFYFSASLLFSGRNCTIGAGKTQLHDLEKIRDAASRYLTWILSPTNEYLSDLLLNFFTEKSRSFEKHGLDTHNVNASVRRKLGKLKVRENKDTTASKEYDGHAMRLWLNEFHDCHETFCKRAVNDRELIGEKTQKILDPRHSLLFRRIPLGIFIWVSDINEEACQCLFHYAASGSILLHDNKKSAMSSRKSDEKEEAIEGVRLVFDLFDVIEEIAESIFDKESEGAEFVCRLKVKAVRFLVMHMEKLLSLQTDEADGSMLMLTHLQRRLSMWKHQLGKNFQGYEDLDEICNALRLKLA
ncbi:hypothetical protein MKW98_009118 [Papaver atlanticum]|uniref:Uncharacterized protein n=1 Tax=Papaver atlanticum TaxID=357466 RepID=A0AAD4T825_9MAGN|nr:hypothetical protein MKW98_009118 [Papaver atlanticum]